MEPLTVLETGSRSKPDPAKLWVRGGFPDSYLAASDEDSYAYQRNFVHTYLERDVPQFGPRIPAETLECLWTMLAHSQGQLLNASKLASNLSTSAPTISNYIDLLVDLLLVRRLQPFHANTKKRLVKAPRVYVRDSGITHALLGLADYNQLSGHPVFGASWEGFVIENLLSVAPPQTKASFYRTSAGAEIDLILELPGGKIWALEIKSGLTPKLAKGFHNALEDIQPDRSFVVYLGKDRYPVTEETEVISLYELAEELAK
ncbi:ATP-binding protein [Nitrosomonas sp.]